MTFLTVRNRALGRPMADRSWYDLWASWPPPPSGGHAGAYEAALRLAEAVVGPGRGARARLALRVLGMAARRDGRALAVALDLADAVLIVAENDDASNVG